MSVHRAWPTPPIARRERAYRRTILFGLSVLLLLATSPLLGHHLPLGMDVHLAGKDHLWALCLIALQTLMAPVHGVFHLLFFAGLAYASWDRYRAWNIQGRALAALRTEPPRPGSVFWRAALNAGLEPARVRIVDALANPAFTTGWLQPRVYVARELEVQLSEAELTAVLAHEGAHVARRDPLRLSLLRFLSRALFWLPALRGLAEDVADETEIHADDRAAAQRPLALASALVKLASWPPRVGVAPGSVGFIQRNLLERRVRRLAGEVVVPRSRVSRGSVWAAGLALSLALVSGGVMAYPIAGQTGSDEHCEQHGPSALTHLFCLGPWAPVRGEDCPHRNRPDE